MVTFGPFVAPRTSTVTDAFASASAPAVTLSPSTSITTGRLTESPTPWATLSISMTSPTATFCCWPPLRTIAYTADSLSSSDYKFGSACRARAHHTEGWGRRTWTHDGASAPRIKSTDGLPTGQNEPSANHLPLTRPLLLDWYVRP